MARLLIAPSTGPIAIALVVPAACDAFPIAKPRAIGLRIRNQRQTTSLTDAPSMPVTITDDTVSATTPPSFSVIPIAIAVVTEIAASDFATTSPSPNNIQINPTENTEQTTPISIAVSIAGPCFLTVVIVYTLGQQNIPLPALKNKLYILRRYYMQNMAP